jgi:hypothetical protein
VKRNAGRAEQRGGSADEGAGTEMELVVDLNYVVGGA